MDISVCLSLQSPKQPDGIFGFGEGAFVVVVVVVFNR